MCDDVEDGWLFAGFIVAFSAPLSCSLRNRAFVPGFVLLLIRESVEEEEETKAGSGCAAERERERDLPHHLA